jgi:hypothetical protein
MHWSDTLHAGTHSYSTEGTKRAEHASPLARLAISSGARVEC